MKIDFDMAVSGKENDLEINRQVAEALEKAGIPQLHMGQ